LPRLRERAPAAERARRISDETMAEFFDAGFHKVMQPTRFGGYGYGHDLSAELVRTVATACGSSGWVTNLATMHNWQVSLFPLEAQEEYWANSHDVFSSTASFAPRSELEAVSGGYRLSGRWKFASGADFARWFIIMKPSQQCLDWFLIPREDVTIVDDWFVSGLCATGSKDIVLDDVFVPRHRVVGFQDLIAGRTPGGLLHDSPFSHLSFVLPGVWGIPAAIIGMVTGMAEALQQTLVGKRLLFSGEKQVDRVANQIALAEALTNIHAAELMMRHRLDEMRDWDKAGGPPDEIQGMHSQRDAAYVARLMGRTANAISIAGGANSAYLANPIQRFLRDVNVAVTHVSLNWEEIAESYGRAKWGLPPKLPAA
jgi:alkylation response protein AidB-like acyl-CoA dehydrogenase